MNNKTERLNEILGDKEFLEANKNLDDFESVFEVVHAIDTEISREELSEYLELISIHMGNGEILEENLEGVVGGGGLTLSVALTLIGSCYAAGYAIGEFIYNWKTRKR